MLLLMQMPTILESIHNMILYTHHNLIITLQIKLLSMKNLHAIFLDNIYMKGKKHNNSKRELLKREIPKYIYSN